LKGDERIWGDGDFVEYVLKAAQENLERKYEFKSQGYGFGRLVKCVARIMKLESDDILTTGKYPQRVRARSLLC